MGADHLFLFFRPSEDLDVDQAVFSSFEYGAFVARERGKLGCGFLSHGLGCERMILLWGTVARCEFALVCGCGYEV